MAFDLYVSAKVLLLITLIFSGQNLGVKTETDENLRLVNNNVNWTGTLEKDLQVFEIATNSFDWPSLPNNFHVQFIILREGLGTKTREGQISQFFSQVKAPIQRIVKDGETGHGSSVQISLAGKLNLNDFQIEVEKDAEPNATSTHVPHFQNLNLISSLNIGELLTVSIILLPSHSFSSFAFFQNLLSRLEKNERTRNSPIFIIWPNVTETQIKVEIQNFPDFLNKQNLNENKSEFGGRSEARRSLRLAIDLDLYFMLQDLKNLTRITLYELYSVKDVNQFNRVDLQNGKINFENLSQKLVRRSQFHGVEIVAVAENNANLAPEVSFGSSNGKGEPVLQSGLSVELFRNLRDMLNFTERAVVGSYIGTRNNTVFGLSYDLIVNESVDISISQVTIFEQRGKAFQILQPTSYGKGILAFFKQPPLNSMRNIFVAPFRTALWLTVIGVWVAIVLVMMLLSMVKIREREKYKYPGDPGPGIGRREREMSPFRRMSNGMAEILGLRRPDSKNRIGGGDGDEGENDGWFLGDAYMWAIGAMCQKGWSSYPSALSMRIVFFCGSFTGLILYIAYSATIVSVLSVKVVPVNDLDQMLDYNFLFYVYENSGTMQSALQGMIDKYNLSQGVLKTTEENEVSLMLTSTQALLSYPDVFYSAANNLNFTDRFLCSTLSSVQTTSHPAKSAMFVRKGSPLTETFNHKILMLKERGFNHRLIRDYDLKTQPHCEQSTTTAAQEQHLDLKDVYIAFIIILVGGLSSLLIVIVEIWWSSRHSHFLNDQLNYSHSIHHVNNGDRDVPLIPSPKITVTPTPQQPHRSRQQRHFKQNSKLYF